MTQRSRMEREVNRIARIVAQDMGIKRGMHVVDCFYLCERAGGAARQCILPLGTSGLFSEDREPGYDIFISLGIELWRVPVAMMHELTHRFTVSKYSYRYDELNTRRLQQYDREEFQEAVARRVEAIFLYACYSD